MEELVALSPGTRVSGRWTIIRKLGAGAFGAVYLCRNDQGQQAALKTEPVGSPHPLLAMEAQVMQNLDRLRGGDGRHFCRCLDLGCDEQRDAQSGQPKQFNYIVMSLVGRGLDGVIKEVGGRFSLGTAVGVSIQMLNALRTLHTIGYLHRDIKPGNSTLGRPENNEQRLLYLIDFRMARRYLTCDGTQRRPRRAASFRGSPPYASISAHIGRDYCRKDDIESWFYVLVELFKGALPWGNIADMNAVGECKRRRLEGNPDAVRRKAIKELIGGCPNEFGQLLKYIDEMKYSDVPDYDWIITTLRSCIKKRRVQELPYDWETGRRNAEQNQAPSGGGEGANSYFN